MGVGIRDYFFKDDGDGSKYGHLPKMVVASESMVVTLRMNRDFMEHMRLYYPEVIKSSHPTFGTIVSAQDVLDQNTTNTVDDVDLY